MTACCFYWFGSLPEKIPSHFGLNGQADAYGPKGMLWILPILYSAILAMTFVLRKFPYLVNLPFKIAPQHKPKAIAISFELVAVINFQVGLMFGYLTYVMIVVALYREKGLGTWFFPLVLVAMGATISVYLMKLKSLSREGIEDEAVQFKQ